MHKLVSASAALLISSPLPVIAQENGALFSAVTLTTDHRFQGVSNSGGRPAVQGYVHWWRPDGWYLGAFASTTRFKGATGATHEIDAYAGRNFDVHGGKTRLTAEIMYSTFPDDRTPGPTLDFLQVKGSVQRTGPTRLKAAAAYTPEASYGAGPAWLAELEAERKLAGGLALKGKLGRRWSDRAPDRSFWSLGAAWTWRSLTFEGRYEDTDLSRAECGFASRICSPTVVGAVTVALPPVH
jgi:uncharacterized protein (TIGR02001 family)